MIGRHYHDRQALPHWQGNQPIRAAWRNYPPLNSRSIRTQRSDTWQLPMKLNPLMSLLEMCYFRKICQYTHYLISLSFYFCITNYFIIQIFGEDVKYLCFLQGFGSKPSVLWLSHAVALWLGKERLQGAWNCTVYRSWRDDRQTTADYTLQEIHMHR